MLCPQSYGLVLPSRLHKQRHIEVTRHYQLVLNTLQNLALVINGATLAHKEGVTIMERLGFLANPVLHTYPDALIVLASIEIVVLGLHIGIVEGLLIGLGRVLHIGRGDNMAAGKAGARIHRTGIAEAHRRGQIGVFPEIAGITRTTLDGLAGHGATRPSLRFLLIIPLTGIAHIVGTTGMMNQDDAVGAMNTGKL